MMRICGRIIAGADSMTTKLSITTYAEQEIIYPDTDGLPLPDNLLQEPFFIEILATLKAFLESLDVLVSGNTLIYYVEGDPSLSVAPDCYVVFGVGRGCAAGESSDLSGVGSGQVSGFRFWRLVRPARRITTSGRSGICTPGWERWSTGAMIRRAEITMASRWLGSILWRGSIVVSR